MAARRKTKARRRAVVAKRKRTPSAAKPRRARVSGATPRTGALERRVDAVLRRHGLSLDEDLDVAVARSPKSRDDLRADD